MTSTDPSQPENDPAEKEPDGSCGAAAWRRCVGGRPARRSGGHRDRARDAPRSHRRLHPGRDPHEPAERSSAQRRRARHLHRDGLPGPARWQREQRGGVLVPRALHARRQDLRRAAPGRRLPPTRVHGGRRGRRRRSRARSHRPPLWRPNTRRPACSCCRSFCSPCCWRSSRSCSCCAGVRARHRPTANPLPDVARFRKAGCSACFGAAAARPRSSWPPSAVAPGDRRPRRA